MILRLILLVIVVLAMVTLRGEGYTYMKPLMFGEAECIDDDWTSHPIGSVWYDNDRCEKLECVFRKNTLYAKGYGCSAIGVPSECKLIPGGGATFPRCCPRVKCNDGVVW